MQPTLKLPLALLLAPFVLMGVLVACSEDEAPPAETFPENPGPITLTTEQLGLPMELHRSGTASASKYGTHADQVGALFIYEQIYSEYRHATTGRGTAADFDNRMEVIFLDSAEGYADEVQLFDERYIIVDLQRRDREWLVDWDGAERDTPENRLENLTFGDPRRVDDYWVEVEDRLTRIAEDWYQIGLRPDTTYWTHFRIRGCKGNAAL